MNGWHGRIKAVSRLIRGSVCEIAVKRDSDVFVAANAILDGLAIFFAMNQSFPRVNVFRFVEIAVGDERQAFESYVVENIVSVCDFPRVEQRRELFLIFPKVKRILAPLAFHDVRMRRDGESALRMNPRDDFWNVERGVNRRFQVNTEQVRGSFFGVAVLVEFNSRHHEHFVTTPRTLAFALDDGKVFANLFLRERHVRQFG